MSTYNDLLTQARDIVANLDYTTPPGTVKVRKRFVIHPNDVLPAIIVCPIAERLQDDIQTEYVHEVEYPVFVGIAIDDAISLENPSIMLEYRELIRVALNSVSSIVLIAGFDVMPYADIIKVRFDTDPSFDRPASRINLDVSGVEVSYTVNEVRNT
jgi:hypothetical protein